MPFFRRRGKQDADWPELVASWKATQESLRQKMVVAPLDPLPRFVAGVDAAFSADDGQVLAAAVVYDRIEQQIVEVAHATKPIEVPYIPTFLSFREGPAVMAAIGALRHPFGVICFDGQGYAHPRRCGLATYCSVLLDVPGIGVAKSRLIGSHDPLGEKAGAQTPLLDGEEQIGAVLRTKTRVRPLFISVGHRVDLASACALVLACIKFRVPEPTRKADYEVALLKARPGLFP